MARYGAHSLPGGFLTKSDRRGIALADAMALSRHRSVAMALGCHQAAVALNNPAVWLRRCLQGTGTM